MGGRATSRAERAGKLLPSRLQPVVTILENALGEVHSGKLDPRAASAMASLAGALVRTITAGELEERLRALEDRGAGRDASNDETMEYKIIELSGSD